MIIVIMQQKQQADFNYFQSAISSDCFFFSFAFLKLINKRD